MHTGATAFTRILTGLALTAFLPATLLAEGEPDNPLPVTKVTLHVRDSTARAALDSLQKQARVTFDADNDAITRRLVETHVAIDAEAKPLLAVLLEVCDAAGVRPLRHVQGRPTIILGDRDGGWSSQFTSVHGAIAIGISKIEHNLRFAYGSRGAHVVPPTYAITLQVEVDPAALTQAQEMIQLRIDKCIGQDSLAIQAYGNGNTIGGVWPSITTLQIRADSAVRIAELEGRCVVRVATAQKRIEVADILKTADVMVDVGLGHVQIKQLQKTGRAYTLQALVMRGNLDDREFDQLVKSIAASRPEIVNAAGQSVALPTGRPIPRAVPSGSQISFTFVPTKDLETPVLMTWNIPIAVKDVEFPFSFKDIPLPVPPAIVVAAAPPPVRSPLAKSGLAKSPPVIEPVVAPRVAPRGPVALTPLIDKPRDFATEVQEIALMFGSPKPEPRQDAMVRLGLLPAASFEAIVAAAKSPDIPILAQKPLNQYIERNQPLLEARLRRAKVLLDQHLREEKTAVESYAKIGKHDPKWDAMVLQGIHAFCMAPNEDALMDARRAFESAIDAGCEDALVLSLTAFAIERTGGNPRQVLRLYEQADKDLSTSKYAAYVKLWNTIRYTSLLRRTASAEAASKGTQSLPRPDVARLAQLRSDLILVWPQVTKDDVPADLLLRAARRIISIHNAAGSDIESVYKPVARALEDALPGKPQPLVFKGIFYTDWAWQGRGNGLANFVSEEESKLFAQRLAIAAEALQQAYDLDPTDPAAATNRINVELGQKKGEIDVWFDRAMKADPDNYEACLNKLLYLEPKWNGSPADMLLFSENCFRSGNYAGQLPMILANAHKALAAYAQRPEIYFANPAVWPDIQRVYEPYLRVRPDDVNARSAYCSYTCLSGNWNVAAKQFDMLGDNVMPAWFGHGSLDDVKQMREKAQQKAGPKDAL